MVLERNSYESMAAMKAHGSTDQFKALGKKMKEEDLVAGPTNLKFIKAVGGFASRL